MKKNSIWLLCSFLLCAGLTCRKSKPVLLAVDFTSRDVWKYRFACTIGGTFSFNDSVSILSSTVSSLLIGKNAENKAGLNISADSVTVTSNTLDEDEVRHLIDRISTAEYTVDLASDRSQQFDSIVAPFAGRQMELDIYRQLLKVLPSLPEKPVKPGFSWEREKQFPVNTSQGKTSCDLYQSFTFDSVRANTHNRSQAYISWRFRYILDGKQFDGAGMVNNLPLAGSGSGNAVLDVSAHALAQAKMVFTTPVCTLSQVTVGWEESASLQWIDEMSSMDNGGK